MKFSVFLAAASLLVASTAMANPICPSGAFSEDHYGDLNVDGAVDVNDLQCMILVQPNVLLGGPLPGCLTQNFQSTQDAYDFADLDCDGKVAVSDFQLTIMLIHGPGLDPTIDADGDDIVDACQVGRTPAWEYCPVRGGGGR